MHLINIELNDGSNGLIGKIGKEYRLLKGVDSILDLAQRAIKENKSLEELAHEHVDETIVDIKEIVNNRKTRQLVQIDDLAHIHLTGTGLTHLGSAEGRDKMHKSAQTNQENITDSMRMFLMGVENGKPDAGQIGAQPEWFYKGNGHNLVSNGDTLNMPNFALDGGEEPEIAGIYLIGENSQVFRLGFALANEFSDHIVEKENYLWLAHSKLRNASIGFELITGELPKNIVGKSKIIRGQNVEWEKPFLSGEDNMSHTIANLEYHHFKYDIFRKPGDIHIHFFGTATASFADGFKTSTDDVFEISADAFDFPLRNPVAIETAKTFTILPL